MDYEDKLLETARSIAYVLNQSIDSSILCPQIKYIIDPNISDEVVDKRLTLMGIDKVVDDQTVLDIQEEITTVGEEEDSAPKESEVDEESTDHPTRNGKKTKGKAKPEAKPKENVHGEEQVQPPKISKRERLKYFETRAKWYLSRMAFEEAEDPDDDTDEKKRELTQEELEEHKRIVKVFYYRQIKDIERRLDKISKGEEVVDIYSSEWKNISKEIRVRDSNACRRCGVTEKDAKKGGSLLHVHHIVPRKRGGSNYPSNLISLCRECHLEVENAPLLL